MTLTSSKKQSKIAPSIEVFKDAVGKIEERTSKKEAQTFVNDLDPRRIQLEAMGIFVDPPLSIHEHRMLGAAKRCMTEFDETPAEIVASLMLVKVYVQIDQQLLST